MSCSSISVKHDYDPEIDFTTYKTFSLYDNAIRGDALSQNHLVKKRVLKSLEKVLTEKGYKLSESGKANFIVVAQAGVKERMEVTNLWGADTADIIPDGVLMDTQISVIMTKAIW